jgi:alkanesulfonate monooxygenase SsuD/methylene tetrahydromethanopterin reductase-like flavin-dependent oxidoreductase (luciferase family)
VCCGEDDREVVRRAENMGRSLDDLRATGLCGTPSEVVDQLGHYVDAGAQRVYLQVLDFADLDHIRLLGAEVLPKLT